MRATYLWAVAIAVLLVSWLASGQLDQEAVAYESSIAERNAESLTLMSDQGAYPGSSCTCTGATADSLRQCSRQDPKQTHRGSAHRNHRTRGRTRG